MTTITPEVDAAYAARFPNWGRYDTQLRLWIIAGDDDNPAEAALAQDEYIADQEREARRANPIADRLIDNARRANAATENQMNWLRKLAAERGVELAASYTKAEASAEIDRIKAMPRAARPAAPARTLVAHGFFSFEGSIVKVQEARNGSGRVYAKRLDATTGSFEYEAGLVGKLTEEMRLTVEQAAEIGHLYGICCCCGRDLTDETSIALGIGPVCRSKHF